MKQPLNTRELINFLYQNRELVEMLFGNKDSINKNEILSREDMTLERLEKLVQYEILHENNNIISLDDRIITFIEDYLEIGEVTTGFINDNIESLKENINYYREFNHLRFLRNIKRSLKKINSTTTREVIKLHKNIDETYKNQSNYFIKLQALEKYKNKRDDITNLIRITEKTLQDGNDVLSTTIDAELSSLVLDLKFNLIRQRDYLIEIQLQIIDYINKIQYQSDILKKIQRLKELKDYEELKYKTNFIEVVRNANALLFSKKTFFKPRLSLDLLFSDHGYQLAKKVGDKLKLFRHIDRKLAGVIQDHEENYQETSVTLNIEALVNKFMKSHQDLFQFIIDYPFAAEAGTFTVEKRISLFVGISIDYDDSLYFTGDFGEHKMKNEQGRHQNIGYAIIFPRSAESLETKNVRKKKNTILKNEA